MNTNHYLWLNNNKEKEQYVLLGRTIHSLTTMSANSYLTASAAGNKAPLAPTLLGNKAHGERIEKC